MISRFLAPHADKAYAAMRMVVGLLFLTHGLQKIFGVLGGHRPEDALIWIGAWIELVAGALVFLGLFTSWAAFIASGEMAVAYVKFHWNFQFDANFFPVVNKGELALLYCFVFLYVACRGSGICAFDRVRARSTSSAATRGPVTNAPLP